MYVTSLVTTHERMGRPTYFALHLLLLQSAYCLLDIVRILAY